MQCDSAEEFILSIVILSPEVEGNFHIIPHLMCVFFYLNHLPKVWIRHKTQLFRLSM